MKEMIAGESLREGDFCFFGSDGKVYLFKENLTNPQVTDSEYIKFIFLSSSEAV